MTMGKIAVMRLNASPAAKFITQSLLNLVQNACKVLTSFSKGWGAPEVCCCSVAVGASFVLVTITDPPCDQRARKVFIDLTVYDVLPSRVWQRKTTFLSQDRSSIFLLPSLLRQFPRSQKTIFFPILWFVFFLHPSSSTGFANHSVVSST